MAEKKNDKVDAKKAEQPKDDVEGAELSDEALTDVTGGSVWDTAIRKAKEDRWFPTV